jgi:uncharacterized protein
MSEEVAFRALSVAASSGVPFHVQLAGGEPTLEPGLIEFVGRTVREARWPATLAVQTNGTLWDRNMVELCRRYDLAVGVSLDGPPDVQTSLRGMSGATFRNLSMFEKEGLPVRVTAVLSSFNVGRLGDLLLTLAMFNNIRGMGFDPVVMSGEAQKKPELIPAPEAVRAGIQMFIAALEQMKNLRNIPFDWREMQVVRQALSERELNRSYCHACLGESLAVHPDGRVYPCGQSVGDPELNAGTVDAVDWAKLRTCYAGVALHGDCASCSLAGRCPGDCPSRLRYNGYLREPVMCTLYRTVADHLNRKTILQGA